MEFPKELAKLIRGKSTVIIQIGQKNNDDKWLKIIRSLMSLVGKNKASGTSKTFGMG